MTHVGYNIMRTSQALTLTLWQCRQTAGHEDGEDECKLQQLHGQNVRSTLNKLTDRITATG